MSRTSLINCLFRSYTSHRTDLRGTAGAVRGGADGGAGRATSPSHRAVGRGKGLSIGGRGGGGREPGRGPC